MLKQTKLSVSSPNLFVDPFIRDLTDQHVLLRYGAYKTITYIPLSEIPESIIRSIEHGTWDNDELFVNIKLTTEQEKQLYALVFKHPEAEFERKPPPYFVKTMLWYNE